MRKLWCLEVEKIGEKILDGISNFFLLENKWREMEAFKRKEREGHFWPIKIGHISPVPMWGTCATWDLRAGWPVRHKASTWGGHGASPTHLSRSSAVFGHPNSDFESIFGLRIVTPSCTTKTMKLWQMVVNSSRKMMMNTTQRMRTKSSVTTSFGLETKRMSNRNDRNSIRNQIRSCSSPKHKKHKQINTMQHKHAISKR